MTNKEYYEEHKDFLSQVARERYATDLAFQENVKAYANKRYKEIQNSKERKQLYNEHRRKYMREYRARKKNQL